MRATAIGMCAILLFVTEPARARERPPVTLPNTEVRSLKAKSNGIDYKLYVSLPKDYDSSERRFGVVYLLDADYSFAIARNIVEHLSDRDHLEPLILVGIAYDGPPAYRLNRTRDYTPTFSESGGYGPEMQKHSGGGPKFLEFLSTELIPQIDRDYRTIEGKRALVGHSYGGLFASWVLLTAPKTFDRYIVVSPSLWYDGRMIFERQKQWSGKPRPPARVYLAVGSGERNARRDMVHDLQQFGTALERNEAKGFTVRHEVLRDETHNSVFPSGLSRGLRWTFEGR